MGGSEARPGRVAPDTPRDRLRHPAAFVRACVGPRVRVRKVKERVNQIRRGGGGVAWRGRRGESAGRLRTHTQGVCVYLSWLTSQVGTRSAQCREARREVITEQPKKQTTRQREDAGGGDGMGGGGTGEEQRQRENRKSHSRRSAATAQRTATTREGGGKQTSVRRRRVTEWRSGKAHRHARTHSSMNT